MAERKAADPELPLIKPPPPNPEIHHVSNKR
jgi:hypothetical protein